MSRLTRILVLAGLFVLLTQGAVTALTPNESIFLYKPGKAVTGTLRDGVFTKKRTLELRGWDLAAASRDSLALYDKDTGKLRTGKFRGGVFRTVETKTIRDGFRRMVASCDTLFLYDPASGRALTGTLVEGKLRHKTNFTFLAGTPASTGWPTWAASCDTIVAHRVNGQQTGELTGGVYTDHGATIFATTGQILAATRDSLLLYDLGSPCGPICGQWGPLQNGVYGPPAGGAPDFSHYDRIAGTASTILFYNSGDGLEARSTLKNGAYAFVGSSHSLGKGWKIITGGR